VAALVGQINARGSGAVAQPNYIYWVPEMGSLSQKAPGSSDYVLTNQKGEKTTLTLAELSKMRRIKKINNVPTAVPTFPIEMTGGKVSMWGWDRINAEIIYPSTSASPTVCVVDTGVDYKHTDLYPKVLNGYDFVNGDSLPNDDFGHGTHVAGTIVAKGGNNSASSVGVSNGNVLAVKSLGGQGFGTSLWVAAGIRYCANASSTINVKVINLSLGGGPGDVAEYNALYYAIVTKNKLVAAAAGNDSVSTDHFPSAWADDSTPAPEGATLAPANNIDQGLISVGAAHINPSAMDLQVWVDTDNSGFIEEGELYEDCATDFSNYGKKVSIVAPGDFIYSTTPASYPFYMNYYYGTPAGYDYWAGTSMATPHVAGAAARVLSVRKTLSNTSNPSLKQWLIATGDPLNYAYDPIMAGDPPFDAAAGYANDGFGVVEAETVDATIEVYKAPYCWPLATPEDENPFGLKQDMSNATYLNLANAMKRSMLWGRVRDAVTGVPLQDALVKATRKVGIVVSTLDTAKIAKDVNTYLILNVPADEDSPIDPYSVISLSVSKSGYTYGYQVFDSFTLDDILPPGVINDSFVSYYGGVSVPPSNTNLYAVMDWWMFANTADLDLMLWLPNQAPTSTKPKGYISPDWIAPYSTTFPGYLPTYPTALNLGYGSMLSATQVAIPTYKPPYAVLLRDGGIDPYYGGLAMDGSPVDTIMIKGSTTYGAYYAGDYNLMATDYSRWYHATSGVVQPCPNPAGTFGCYPNALGKEAMDEEFNYLFVDPAVRVWQGGKILKTIILWNSTDVKCNENADFWKIAKINGKTVTAFNTCGNASQSGTSFGILPYGQ
jgi:subtilisin family serine protease